MLLFSLSFSAVNLLIFHAAVLGGSELGATGLAFVEADCATGVGRLVLVWTSD